MTGTGREPSGAAPSPRGEGPARAAPEDAAVRALAQALRISFRVLKGILVVVLASFLLSGVFSVPSGEVAIVLRFGKVAGVYRPGLHWTWPEPISTTIRLPGERTLTLEVEDFWYRPTPSERLGRPDAAETVPDALRPGVDGYVLTGDANILHMRWKIAYRVADPLACWRAFHGMGARPAGGPAGGVSIAPACEAYLRSALDGAVVAAVGRFRAEDALRLRIDELRAEVTRRLRARLGRPGEDAREGAGPWSGIALVGDAFLVADEPPRQVAEAFAGVVRAEQERSRALNEARGYEAETGQKAEGEARQRIAAAEGYRVRVEAEAQAAAERFARLLAAYRKTPEVFVARAALDALREIVASAEEVFVLRGGALRLRINRSPEAEEKRKREFWRKMGAPGGEGAPRAP